MLLLKLFDQIYFYASRTSSVDTIVLSIVRQSAWKSSVGWKFYKFVTAKVYRCRAATANIGQARPPQWQLHHTVIQVAKTRLEIGFDIWLLETCKLCLIFISKGHFLLKKIIQGHKGQKGQWRPTKARIAQNFKILCYYHYSM